MSSAELSKARKQLSEVRSLIKKGRLFPAVQFLHAGITTMMRTSLIKNERAELEDMVHEAVSWVAKDEEIRKIFPLAIVYKPGEEEALADVVQQLLTLLEARFTEEASAGLKVLEERREKMLAEIRALLNTGELDKAAELHEQFVLEFGEDYGVLAEIGEHYLDAERYDEAFDCLSRALEANPDAIYLYNRVGIVLRKMERYDLAEKYYKKALQIAGKDVGLLFNLGRLYVEWQQWTKAERVARMIVKIAPDFTQGSKLLAYIEKNMKAGQTQAVEEEESDD